MPIDKKAKQKLAIEVKLGIIKQLFKDNLISDSQYKFLINKYSPAK
jgi:hypothetical protein